MAKDWALSSEGATLGVTFTGGGTTNYFGSDHPERVHDGIDSSQAWAASTGGVGQVIFDITLTGIRNLAEIKFYVYGLKGYSDSSYGTAKFEYYDGSWHELETINIPGAAAWYTYSAGYAGVSHIRLTANVYYTDSNHFHVIGTYTMTANGVTLVDSGLRIKKTGLTISVACETLSTYHKLRFRKGGTTVGIPLVSTTDTYASPVRVYDGSAVKAIMKYS